MKRVMVASPNSSVAETLKPFLSDCNIKTYGQADALMLDSRKHPPDVIVVYEDFNSEIPFLDFIDLMRRRPDLIHTQWIALGNARFMLDCARHGIDSVLPTQTPPVLLGTVVLAKIQETDRQEHYKDRAETLEDKMREMQRDEEHKEQLVHMLVHDLKNPVSAVLGLLDLVIEEGEALLPRDLLTLIKTAYEEANHVLYMAANILDVRKMQGGKMVLRKENLDREGLEDVIQGAKRDSGNELQESRHFHMSIASTLPKVAVDPTLLRRVLANLISNAVKHTNTGGTIAVRLKAAQAFVEIEVSDDGEGIPQEDLPKLFRPFEQARTTIRGRFDSGMGLAFCKLAIEQHGGTISVQSTRGMGTRFSFSLPVISNEDDDIELVD